MEKGKQFIECGVPVNPSAWEKAADLQIVPPDQDTALAPDSVYRLTLSYPILSSSGEPPYPTSIEGGPQGKSSLGVVEEIRRAYRAAFVLWPKDHVFHSINDLFIEGVEIDHDQKTIHPKMGS